MGHGGELKLGHHGAGDDCFGKVFGYVAGGATAGAAYGTVEGCFLKPVKGSTTPMVFRAFQVILSRAVLIGTVGGTFAAGACVSAGVRNKDDYVNAAVGGMLAGSVFGIKYRSWPLGLGLASGMGLVLGAIKYSLGTYLPTFPSSESESTQDRH